MPLRNSQYDTLMRRYEEIRETHRHELLSREAEIAEKSEALARLFLESEEFLEFWDSSLSAHCLETFWYLHFRYFHRNLQMNTEWSFPIL